MKNTSGTTMLANSWSRRTSSPIAAVMIPTMPTRVGGSVPLPPTDSDLVDGSLLKVAAERIALAALTGLRLPDVHDELLDLAWRRRRQQRDDPDGQEAGRQPEDGGGDGLRTPPRQAVEAAADHVEERHAETDQHPDV